MRECPTCHTRIEAGARISQPCFVCAAREAIPGQILCPVCFAWAEAADPGGLSLEDVTS